VDRRFAAVKGMILKVVAVATALMLAVAGAWLFIGGVWLALLGGSLYYAIAGTALLFSAKFYWRFSNLALWTFAGLIVFTIVWALWEVGFDGWKLEPRLVAPVVFGGWLALPFVRARLGNGGRGIAALVVSIITAAAVMTAGFSPTDGY
jgi:quinoprotein glucose dehydrogenase